MNHRIKEIVAPARRKESGYAMIVVLCLLALFMALGLSVLFASSLSVSRANLSYTREQCRISAISLSKQVEDELKDPGTAITQYIWREIETNNWQAYNEESQNDEIAKRTYHMTMDSELLAKTGDMTMKMYWQVADEIEKVNQNYTLVVCITSKKGEEQYSVTTEYATDKKDADGKWTGGWAFVGRDV
ncbi:MAG: hypothetical protein RR791_05925 [Lachnospiraceae bacterium]